MIDLTYFLFNSISFLESTATTQETSDPELPVELSNESIDQDNAVDPSSFVLLFADILANNTENKESKANSCSSESSVLNANTPNSNLPVFNLRTQENKEIKTDKAKIDTQIMEQDKPVINTETTVTHEDQHITDFEWSSGSVANAVNHSINLSPEVKQLPLDVLENNVAMAWINSENFQPPQSIRLTDPMGFSASLEYGVSAELAEFIVDNNELIESALKKEMPIEDDEGQITEIFNNELLSNTNDNLPKDLHAVPAAKNNLFTARPEIRLEPAIENTMLVGAQESIQSPALSFSDNQPLINSPATEFLDIPVNISDSQWVEKFSEHIVWLGQQGLKSALIKIHPEDLGPLEISIKVVKDSASVSIHSHSSHVCDIVDQALPRLREMMTEQGLNLSDVYVGTDERSRQFPQNNYGAEEVVAMHTEDEVQAVPLAQKARDGLIDYFA